MSKKKPPKVLALRIIAVDVDANAAAHVGGPVHVEHKTFDVPIPASMAEWLETVNGNYSDRSIVGVEIIRENVY